MYIFSRPHPLPGIHTRTQNRKNQVIPLPCVRIMWMAPKELRLL